jgi:CheY-like chemotaxis protein
MRTDPMTAAGPDAPGSDRPRRVLVVDDHPDTAESLALLLSAHGYDARAFTSGPAALAGLAEFTPDVCLLDLRMCPMDGYALAAQLRTVLGPRPVLMAVTGELGAVGDERAALFDRVFVKPPDIDQLLGAVAAVLPARTQRRP